MAVDVVMPQMGESVVEGTVAKWLVKEGDKVAEDQPIVEISTDKVDTEIPSPASGTIVKIVAAEGQTLPVGAQLAVIETVDGKAQRPPSQTPSKPAAPQAAMSVSAAEPPSPTALAQRPTAEGTQKSSEGQAPERKPQQPEPVQSGNGARAEAGDAHARYSPLVMKMAAEHRIDLGKVKGTGLGGRITKRDVQNYLDSLAAGPAAPVPSKVTPTAAPAQRPAPAASEGGAIRAYSYQPREGDKTEPFTRRRKVIADHMVYSKTHSPHVGTVAEVDMTRVSKLRDQNKEGFRVREGFGLTFLPLVVAATARALRDFPGMNASVVADSLVVRKDINIGVAVDTQEGLVVPVIRQADQKSVLGIAREIEELHRKAVEKRITVDELSGGSFTVTNPGREGNLFGLAIINQPQVGILRMGEVKKKPVVIEVDGADTISIRPIMYLALSYDHRVVDGVLGNRFLFRVARILEEGNFTL